MVELWGNAAGPPTDESVWSNDGRDLGTTQAALESMGENRALERLQEAILTPWQRSGSWVNKRPVETTGGADDNPATVAVTL